MWTSTQVSPVAMCCAFYARWCYVDIVSGTMGYMPESDSKQPTQNDTPEGMCCRGEGGGGLIRRNWHLFILVFWRIGGSFF